MKKTFRFYSFLSYFILLFGFCACNPEEVDPDPIEPEIPEVPLEKEGYTLVLNEEFEQTSIDQLEYHKNHWLLDANGWKESLLSIGEGKLIVQAAILDGKEVFEGRSYANEVKSLPTNQAGGVLHSQGLHQLTGAGFLEVKARFPEGGENLFASIMLMSDNWGNWPSGFARFNASGDGVLDLGMNTFAMYSKDAATASITSPNTQRQIDHVEDFHTYGIEWRPGELTFYLDGEVVDTEEAFWISEDSEVYFMLAVFMDNEAVAPERGMEVEYLRWYEKSE